MTGKLIRHFKNISLSKKTFRSRPRGRGAKFQNYKIVHYGIVQRNYFWPFVSITGKDLESVVMADYIDDHGWWFKNQKAAEQAWLTVCLKFSE